MGQEVRPFPAWSSAGGFAAGVDNPEFTAARSIAVPANPVVVLEQLRAAVRDPFAVARVPRSRTGHLADVWITSRPPGRAAEEYTVSFHAAR